MRKFVIVFVALIVSSAIVINTGCKKEDKENNQQPVQPTPPTYTNGEGEIGQIGGTVMIDDPASPIHGASIEIPEGALASIVNIKLEVSENDYSGYGLENIKVVKISPHGLTFNKDVELTLPWSSEDQSIENTVATYLNPDTFMIELLPIKALDVLKKHTTVTITHLSDYSTYTTPVSLNLDFDVFEKSGIVGASLQILTPFNEIPPMLTGGPGANAYEIIENVPDNSASSFDVRLYEISANGYYNWIAAQRIKINHTQSPYYLKVLHATGSNAYNFQEIFNKDLSGFNEVIYPWMQGKGTIAMFENEAFFNPAYELSSGETYVITINWAITKETPGSHVWTWPYMVSANFSIDNLPQYNGDVNNNQIVDQYETNSPPGGESCPGIPTVTYEGQTYNTVLIGEQCWLKENLNVGTMINGGDDMLDNGTIEKYCYDNDPANCEIYGGLYQWDEMMNYTTQEGTQGICPEGWHIPTDDEWKTLEGTADSQYPVGGPIWDNTAGRGYDVGKNLKSITGWSNNGNGSGIFGFEALPGSYRKDDGSFEGLFFMSFIWSSNIDNANFAWYRGLSSSEDDAVRNSYSLNSGFSIRCMKDVNIVNTPPTASFTVSPTSGTTQTTFNFDASASFDNEDPTSQLQVRWDFDGDGSWDTGWDYIKVTNRQYENQGIYYARVEVKDTEDLSDLFTQQIEVTSQVNTPPVAVFSVDPTSGTTSTIFEFDASASYDNEDPTSQLQVRWDWESDGNWDTGWNTDKSENHQYSNENIYTIKLEVMDTEGLTATITHSVNVSNGGGGSEPCPGTPTVTYEGQTYNTVLIGNQCWLQENLNVGTMISGSDNMQDNDVIEKYCYDNNPANCDTYGGLYQWDEMMQYVTTEGTQGICPPGWHLPTDDEWKILEGTVDSQYPVGDPEWDGFGWRGYDAGKNLKSTLGWSGNNGSDAFGFTALPGGFRIVAGIFDDGGNIGYWSSATEYSSSNSFRRYLKYDVIDRLAPDKRMGFSVRCLKD